MSVLFKQVGPYMPILTVPYGQLVFVTLSLTRQKSPLPLLKYVLQAVLNGIGSKCAHC